MNHSSHNNHGDKAHADFEVALSRMQRRNLPVELRETILDHACGSENDRHRWAGVPRPLAWSVAACWVGSICFHLATPTVPAYSKSRENPELRSIEKTESDRRAALAFAWVERGRLIAQPESIF